VKDQIVLTALPISLNNVVNYTEFTNLFDTFSIASVDVSFLFTRNSSEMGSSAVGDLIPILVTANDYDDATAPALISDLFQYDSCHFHRLDQPLTVSFKPRVAASLYLTAVTTAYSQPNGKTWVDAGNAGCPWYGLKWGIMGDMGGGIGANTIGYLTTIVRYHIQCKDTR